MAVGVNMCRVVLALADYLRRTPSIAIRTKEKQQLGFGRVG
jgi:hypothetical protein